MLPPASMPKSKKSQKRLKLIRPWVQAHWLITLSIVGLFGLIINVVVFYPGYMSNDSMSQFMQASGQIPVSDWHPPIMVFVWGLLLKITNISGSLLIVQLAMLWVAMFIIALVVYSKTRSYKYALLPFLVPIVPFVFNISGVLWKDVQMAYALLLAVSLIVAAMHFKRLLLPWMKVSLAAGVALLLLYAALLRYNALFAAIPILVFAAIAFGYGRKVIIASIAGFLLLFVGTQALIGTFVQSDNPISSVMLDDIVTVNSREEIERMAINDELKQTLLSVQGCIDDTRFVNLYLVCANDIDRKNISVLHYGELKDEWVSSVVGNLPQYVSYRLQSFALFVFSQGDSYIWHSGINENVYGLKVANERIGNIAGYYVKASYDVFPILYKVWFWLLFAIGLFAYAIKRVRYYKGVVVALSLSAVIYIVAYVPVVVATDYRYIYWPVIAVLVAFGFVLLDRKADKKPL